MWLSMWLAGCVSVSHTSVESTTDVSVDVSVDVDGSGGFESALEDGDSGSCPSDDAYIVYVAQSGSGVHITLPALQPGRFDVEQEQVMAWDVQYEGCETTLPQWWSYDGTVSVAEVPGGHELTFEAVFLENEWGEAALLDDRGLFVAE